MSSSLLFYRGFDIGNHFNEYAGYDCDYSLYPSKVEQFHFFRHYLEPEKPLEVSDKDLQALYVETNTYMLASHLYWALWALIQTRNATWLVAPAIVAGLGALTHTLGTVVPVIGASGFATAAATIAIGTIVGSFR